MYYTAAATIAIQVIVAIFVYGKLTQKVSTNTETLKEHDKQLLRHDREIGEVYGEVGLRRQA
jgi:hypothetical protein